MGNGPSYVCTCCKQTWFRHIVRNVSNIQLKCRDELRHKCLTSFVSNDSKEWLCNTCLLSLQNNKVSLCAVVNGMAFPPKPTELILTSLEERLVASRIPFMQIREMPRGGQLSITRNVVNMSPSDVTTTVNCLPGTLSDDATIQVKLKRKTSSTV